MPQDVVWALQVTATAWNKSTLLLCGTLDMEGELEAVLTLPGSTQPQFGAISPKERGHKQKPHQDRA